ncbi:MAG TPA: alcohol dehydrogenase catalytic domain-containing protein [Mycobacteriales bacterium]|jgi:Zn-dependent alcohol dehydrogenase
MTRQVRAAVVDGPGGSPCVTEVDLPAPGPDEVEIAIAAVGICHTDVAWAAGDLGAGYDFPVVLGHEVSAVVRDVGSQVSRVRPGDHVVLSLTHHCGHCAFCEAGTPMLCEQRTRARPRLRRHGDPLVQGYGTGGFAEATVVAENSVVRIPDTVPLAGAALLGCAIATGIGAVMNIARVEVGSTCAVIGLGGIGLSAVAGARLAGAASISVADPLAERRAAATRFGATETFEDAESLLAGRPGRGFDFTFEATGRPDAMAQAVAAARPGGTVTVIGAPRHDAQLTLPALDFVTSQKRLLGCLTGNVRPDIDVERLVRLVEAGRLDLEAFVTRRIPLDRIADGFGLVERGEGIRTVVEM